MSSGAVNGRSGSTIARLPCNQRGSIGLSQGLFTGSRHTRIRTPPMRFTVFQFPTFSGGGRTPCVVGIGRDSVSGTKSPAGEVPHGCDDPPVVGGRARRMRVRGSAFGPAPAQTHRAHGGRDRGKPAACVPRLGEHEGGLPLLLQ